MSTLLPQDARQASATIQEPRRNFLRNNAPKNARHPLRRQPGRPGSDVRRQAGAGNARRNYERYIVLAREAALNGDDVEMENCYQHAEHYYRVMNGRE
jgi:hypothetical protein